VSAVDLAANSTAASADLARRRLSPWHKNRFRLAPGAASASRLGAALGSGKLRPRVSACRDVLGHLIDARFGVIVDVERPALSWTVGATKCDLQRTLYAVELIQSQQQQLIHRVHLMLKFLARLTIIDSSDEALKFLQSMLQRTDALAQHLTRTPGLGNLNSGFSERQLNDVGPIGTSGCVSSAG